MTIKEITDILSDPASASWLFQKADEIRRLHCGDDIHVRGIIEFSNICKRNCLYCGLRAKNAKVRRYRLTESEIVKAALAAAALDIRTLVLQSGEDVYFDVKRLCSIIRVLKKETGAAVTLSVGERTRDEYAAFKKAGADRFLLRFETSDPGLFAMLKPDSSFENRFNCLKWLREAGFQVGSGIMTGVPGQSFKILAGDLLRFQELNLDMVGIGPFIPHPDTPLGPAPGCSIDLALKAVALTRLLTLNAHIPATTAIGTVDPLGRQKALRCGANVIMPNVGPLEYREDYAIYPDKICVSDTSENCAACVNSIIAGLGRTRAAGPGHTLKASGPVPR
ncbi:MAG: [FeFe] hydrogenase H-cluster radical SAM maturase HydE [Lentisphaerae bacterium GWF2_52_8]|nr:MAG: [FeFe] hydrogenase H-cluster radical SAM maturase HydE [Lentisphaerae bacterium GWF2_52_8]